MAGKDYLRLRQICLVARDLRKAEDDVRAIFGVEACYHDLNVGKYGLQNALFPMGDKLLEVVVPTRDGTAAGRFLDRFGARGGYMVILDWSAAVSTSRVFRFRSSIRWTTMVSSRSSFTRGCAEPRCSNSTARREVTLQRGHIIRPVRTGRRQQSCRPPHA